VWTFAGFEPQARAIARTLRTLGFQSRMRMLDDGHSLDDLAPNARRWPQVGVIGWAPDVPEPAQTIRALLSCATFTPRTPGLSLNRSGYCDPSLDAAVDRAAAAGPAAGLSWQRIEQRIAHVAPLVPLYTARTIFATSPRLGHLQANPFVYSMLDRAWVR
jgi:ABC-type oligopeptide transport system substrate-binding subunit